MTPLEGLMALLRDLALFRPIYHSDDYVPLPEMARLSQLLADGASDGVVPWQRIGRLASYLDQNGQPALGQKQMLNDVLLPVLGWALGSRRVYSLSGDLSLALSATHFSGVDILDPVQLPLEQFILELKEPIHGRDGVPIRYVVSALIPPSVTHLTATAHWMLGVPDTFAAYEPLSRMARTRLTRAIQKVPPGTIWYEIPSSVTSVMERLMQAFVNCRIASFTVADFESRLMAVYPERIQGSTEPVSRTMSRLVWGFSLYLHERGLQVSAASSVHAPRACVASRRGRAALRGVSLVPETVFDVGANFTLPPRTREAFRRSISSAVVTPTSQPPKWVAGYSRRPPGKGSNPTAKKTVRVAAHIWNKSALEDGQVPRGTKVDIT